jgi:hypothetical protein
LKMEIAERQMSELGEIPAGKKRGILPALALFFTAPLVAEFLLGNLPIKLLPALIVLAPMYGGGALLIREWVRRTGRGWPSILLLGMAYAIFEEAFTTQSLFNPNYLKLNLGLLTPAYIPALGIGGWWTLWMFNVHAVWSIATPIALIEACVPDRARTPWLGRVGLAVTMIVFLLGATAAGLMQFKQDPFRASAVQFIAAAMVVVVLAVAAFVIPVKGRRYAMAGWAPSPWMVGVVGLLFGSAALFVPQAWGWGAVTELLGLDLVMLLAVLAWSRRDGWGLEHQLALGAGAALAYGWHAFLQHPAVGGLDASVRVGNAIFLVGAVCLIWFAATRVRAAHGDLARPAD